MTKDKIVVTVKWARLIRDTDTFGSMEPYCKLKYDGNKQKTKIDKSGGKTPTWNETFTYELTHCTVIVIAVWDSDTFSNDEIGTAEIDINVIKSYGSLTDWIKLKHKGKEAGEIYCEIMYMPLGGAPASIYTPPPGDYHMPAPVPMHIPAPASYVDPSHGGHIGHGGHHGGVSSWHKWGGSGFKSSGKACKCMGGGKKHKYHGEGGHGGYEHHGHHGSHKKHKKDKKKKHKKSGSSTSKNFNLNLKHSKFIILYIY